MDKLSKSDTIDLEQESESRAALRRILSTPLKHWTIGSAVLVEGRRYTLTGIDYADRVIFLEDEDGNQKFCFDPHFIQWEVSND